MANAVVLPVDKVASGEPQVLAGVPGRWVPGQLYSLDLLGLSEQEFADLIESQGLPLELVTAGDGEFVNPYFDPTPNKAPSGFQDTAAARSAEAAQEAPDAFVTSTGATVTPTAPAPNSAEPWAQADIDRATAATLGELDDSLSSPMSANVAGDTLAGGGLNAADTGREELRAEVEGLTVPGLDERYGEIDGYPAAGKKDEKLSFALAHEGFEEA